MAAHVKKCPSTKQSNFSERQAYFCQGVNSGCDGQELSVSSDLRDDSSAVFVDTSFQGGESRSSAAKRAAITGLSEDQFLEFVKRIEIAHEACCLGNDDEAFFQPPQCSKWWDPDRDRFVALPE